MKEKNRRLCEGNDNMKIFVDVLDSLTDEVNDLNVMNDPKICCQLSCQNIEISLCRTNNGEIELFLHDADGIPLGLKLPVIENESLEQLARRIMTSVRVGQSACLE